MKRITLWRHGEINAAGLLVGRRSDLPLNAAGYAMMREGWAALCAVEPVTALACSPLQRCREPAEAFAAATGLALHVGPGFAETDFGLWDGAPLATLPEGWQDAYGTGRLLPEGGESPTAFRTRVDAEFGHWVASLGDGHAVLITHGGVIAAVLANRLGVPLSVARHLFVARGGHVQLSLVEGYPAYLTALVNPPG